MIRALLHKVSSVGVHDLGRAVACQGTGQDQGYFIM